MRTLALSVAPLLLASCSGGALPPAGRPAPAAPERAVASSASASSGASTPAPPPAAPAAPASPFSVVLRSSTINGDAYPFPGGAVLSGRSFMAVVLGDDVRQDPAFVAGLPEYINWDASVWLTVPVLATPPSAPGIPDRTELLVHAGNRHGPGGTFHWNGRGWARGAVAKDKRLSRLPADPDGVQEVLALPSGHLFVVRSDPSAVTAYAFAPGESAPSKQPVPLKRSEWATAQIVAASPKEVYLCTFLGEIAALRDGVWATLAPPAGAPASCAATQDGSLWVVTDGGRDGKLLRRAPSGAWEQVALPAPAQPEKVAAAGDRVWVVARAPRSDVLVLSNAPVKTPIEIGPRQMPSPPDAGGITAFDQTSVDVLSVSADPAGPGTSACSSLVVHFGVTRTPELEAALKKHPETAGVLLSTAEGIAPGKVAPIQPDRAAMRHQPSSRKAPALVAIPQSFDEGLRWVDALAPELPDAPPRLLCAKPRLVKR